MANLCFEQRVKRLGVGAPFFLLTDEDSPASLTAFVYMKFFVKIFQLAGSDAVEQFAQ
jgi:hypothetical protein